MEQLSQITKFYDEFLYRTRVYYIYVCKKDIKKEI